MAKMSAKGLVKSNLELWLNDKLLSHGLFNTIPSGYTDIYGNDLSSLSASSDPSHASGTVFQSAFKNWVYESGIVMAETGVAQPIVCSGVFVNGIFRATSSGSPLYSASHAHNVDFPNGRILFSSPQAGAIQAEFSYKTVGVYDAQAKDNENRRLLIETAWKDNPAQTGVDIYPHSSSRTLPAVFIEMRDRRNLPYELGTTASIKDLIGVFHVWSRDGYMLDLVEDILGNEHHSVILGINFNDAQYPLNHLGDRNSQFTHYTDYANVDSPYFWRRIYLEDVIPTKDPPLFEIERSRVNFRARVYPNF